MGETEWNRGEVERKREDQRSNDVHLEKGGAVRRNRVDLYKMKRQHEDTDTESETDGESEDRVHEDEEFAPRQKKVHSLALRRSTRLRRCPDRRTYG